MFLDDPDDIPLVLSVEVLVQGIPRARGPWATGKGEGAPLCRLWEAHILYLQVMLHMTDRHSVPVYLQLHPVHAITVCRHNPRGDINSALQSRDPAS